MKTKICAKCGVTKDDTHFYSSSVAKKTIKAAGINSRPVYSQNNELSKFTPRELMLELRNRGYEGELVFTSKINLSDL